MPEEVDVQQLNVDKFAETEMYLSQMLTLQICAEIHRGNQPQRKVRAAAKRLAQHAAKARHFRVCQIWAVTAELALPIAHLEKLRSRLEMALEGKLTMEDVK